MTCDVFRDDGGQDDDKTKKRISLSGVYISQHSSRNCI
jgi:hypothetical protein